MENDTGYVMYMVAAPQASAEELARTMVEERAAACAQVTGPVTSFFHWEGKLRRETETLILVKTVRNKAEEIKRILAARHPYDVPELIELPVSGGNQAYFRWMDDVLSGGTHFSS